MQKDNSIWKYLSGQRAEQIVTFAIIPLLLVASLLLPPFRVVTRISDIGWTAVKYDGATLQDPDGTVVNIPAGLPGKTLRVLFSSVPRERFMASEAGEELAKAASAIPQTILPRSPLYQLKFKQAAAVPVTLTIPIPNDSEPVQALDLYAWTGTAWRWLPSIVHPDEDIITAELPEAPSAFLVALAQPAAKKNASSGLSGGSAAVGISGAQAPNALVPSPDGSVQAVFRAGASEVSASPWAAMPLLTNVDEKGQADLATLDAILGDEARMADHIAAIVKRVTDGKHAGITLDYRGFDAGLTARFSDFVGDLADALHQAGALLAVRVPAPVAVDGGWDTGPYDWAALGQRADVVRFAAPANPKACIAGGALEQALAWAVSQVPRQKLAVEFCAMSLDVSAAGVQHLPMTEALLPLSQLAVQGDTVEVLPGQEVKLNAGLGSNAKLTLDPATNAYVYEYADAQGAKHTVWIDDGAALARKLQTLAPYRIGGVFLTDLTGDPAEERMTSVLAQYAADQAASVKPCDLTLVYTVQGDGGPLAQATRSLQDGAYTFSADQPGEYVVAAGISLDGGRTVSGRGDRVEVKVVTPTPIPTPTPTPKPTATPAPKAVAPAAPKVGGFFGYGIQAHFINQGDHDRIIGAIHGLGFSWVKQQVRWEDLEKSKGQIDWGELDRMVNNCSANGLKILLSVVTAPDWARPGDTDRSVDGPPANPDDYANFIGQLAARYKGKVQAYEVWNEQNLYYEWGGRGKKLSAAAYMELLKRAYRAIKAVDPNAIVVSGALTPTGWHDYDTAVDDAIYLEEMYQNGLKNYSDAIGAHPSGYNNPPDATVGYNDPNEGGCKGHRSWFFRATMEQYRNVMIKYGDAGKRIWVTEFGWASTENLGGGPAPGYEYAANNTEAEQAQYIVRAYQMAKNWGFVGVMFLWNLNFAPVAGPADEKAAFGIVRADWSLRPAYAALANMPK
ncbi:MAG: cellulase family glycosylhydrolase [Anaerolineae bacterium]|nr:cellulase family glycosylhydrolase [Anaerolineae bacterium]